MRSLVVKKFGLPPQMIIEERQRPEGKEGFTLVRMKAATINQLSNTVRSGGIPGLNAPLVLGNEGAGVVEWSTRFSVGTRVAVYGAGQLGMVEDGLQQQWALVEDKRLFELPDELDFDEGAAITVNYITAYQALTRIAGVKKGQTVLVSGATGSLGHALVQTARALGAHPIAIVSNASKAARAKQAGVHDVIDLACTDLRTAVLDITNGKGADLAMDPVGGQMLGHLAATVRLRGTVVAIGFAGGLDAAIDLVDLIVQEKRVLGYDLHLETDDDVTRVLGEIRRLISAGQLRPVIDSVFALDEFEEAYRRLASREAVGAVVLRL